MAAIRLVSPRARYELWIKILVTFITPPADA